MLFIRRPLPNLHYSAVQRSTAPLQKRSRHYAHRLQSPRRKSRWWRWSRLPCRNFRSLRQQSRRGNRTGAQRLARRNRVSASPPQISVSGVPAKVSRRVITRSTAPLTTNTHDAIRPRSISQAQARPPAIDAGMEPAGSQRYHAEDPVRQDLVRDVVSRGGNVPPTISA